MKLIPAKFDKVITIGGAVGGIVSGVYMATATPTPSDSIPLPSWAWWAIAGANVFILVTALKRS